MENYLTIGELAGQVGVPASTLRYYEAERLLMPAGRTPAGYRQYGLDSIQRVHLIQRARRLGFSLADIRLLLESSDTGELNDRALIELAERRYLQLEKQVTERLVLQHELELFLQDLQQRSVQAGAASADFEKLLEQVCAHPGTKTSANFVVNWLTERVNCNLTGADGRRILDRLRGQHVHIWQEKGEYHILFVSTDESIAAALRDLAALESDCEMHAATQARFVDGEEGFLFVARGDNAFIFARLFLALELESSERQRTSEIGS